MNCLLCQKKIGILRRLIDRRFCCDDHRKRFPAFSAKAAREATILGDQDFSENWLQSTAYLVDRDRRTSNPQASPALLGFFALLFVMLAFIGVPGSGSRRQDIPPIGPSFNVAEALKNAIRNRAAVRFTEDFRSGLTAWKSAGNGTEWSYSDGFVRPGRLRLWDKSMNLSDYQIEFQSQIESKGLGWVYRAQDERNHYATRIMVPKNSSAMAAEILRYAMVGGRQEKKTRLPLPLIIRPDISYRIQVSVRGDRFSTLVNGHMVDSWSDKRFAKGGVGFFGEKGDVATLRWVSISDRNTFVGRLFSFAQPAMFFPMYLPE